MIRSSPDPLDPALDLLDICRRVAARPTADGLWDSNCEASEASCFSPSNLPPRSVTLRWAACQAHSNAPTSARFCSALQQLMCNSRVLSDPAAAAPPPRYSLRT
eukprot:353956-Chlamydomonas_euryale.AAC.2